jgi:class 3 adenylate cyclase
MSGFSRIARERGIVFYLAMVRRMQQVTGPVVASCAGTVVKYEADNLYAVFENPIAALSCAIRINQAVHADNQDEADDVAHVRVSIGIETGMILLVDGDFFGNAVNTASKLGEDLAEASEVLIGPDAAKSLPKVTLAKLVPRHFDISGIGIDALSLSLSDGRDPGIELYEGTPLD